MLNKARNIHDAATLANITLAELNYEIDCCRALLKIAKRHLHAKLILTASIGWRHFE